MLLHFGKKKKKKTVYNETTEPVIFENILKFEKNGGLMSSSKSYTLSICRGKLFRDSRPLAY